MESSGRHHPVASPSSMVWPEPPGWAEPTKSSQPAVAPAPIAPARVMRSTYPIGPPQCGRSWHRVLPTAGARPLRKVIVQVLGIRGVRRVSIRRPRRLSHVVATARPVHRRRRWSPVLQHRRMQPMARQRQRRPVLLRRPESPGRRPACGVACAQPSPTRQQDVQFDDQTLRSRAACPKPNCPKRNTKPGAAADKQICVRGGWARHGSEVMPVRSGACMHNQVPCPSDVPQGSIAMNTSNGTPRSKLLTMATALQKKKIQACTSNIHTHTHTPGRQHIRAKGNAHARTQATPHARRVRDASTRRLNGPGAASALRPGGRTARAPGRCSPPSRRRHVSHRDHLWRAAGEGGRSTCRRLNVRQADTFDFRFAANHPKRPETTKTQVARPAPEADTIVHRVCGRARFACADTRTAPRLQERGGTISRRNSALIHKKSYRSLLVTTVLLKVALAASLWQRGKLSGTGLFATDHKCRHLYLRITSTSDVWATDL